MQYTVYTFTKPQTMLSSMRSWFAHPYYHKALNILEVREDNDPNYLSYICRGLNIIWRLNAIKMKNFPAPFIAGSDEFIGQTTEAMVRFTDMMSKNVIWRKRFAEVFSKMKHTRAISAENAHDEEFHSTTCEIQENPTIGAQTCAPTEKQHYAQIAKAHKKYVEATKPIIIAEHNDTGKKRGFLASLASAIWGN